MSGYMASYAVWQDASGNTVTPLHTGWGDLLVHIRAVTFLAQQPGLPSESFLLSGQSIGYSYAADWISSFLWKAGAPIASALQWPTVILVMCAVAALLWTVFSITRSTVAALLATLLFIGFSGISGFATLPELQKDSFIPWQQALRDLPHEVTAWHDANLVILNPFVMILHQRAYLLGFPLFIMLVWAAWLYVEKKSWEAGIAAIFLGIALAYAHPFTWVAAVMILPSWAAWTFFLKTHSFTAKQWTYIGAGLVAIAAGGFAIVHSLQPLSTSSFISFHPGWLDPTISWPVFWLKNIGLYLPLFIWSLYHLWERDKKIAALALSALTPFVAGNIFQFAPWIWDNTKIFAPVWIIMCLAISSLLSSWWREKSWGKVAVVILLPALTFSGALEITRAYIYSFSPMTLATASDEAVGAAIRNNSTNTDVILTAPTPNEGAFLFSGRPSLVAYEGWLWSQGWQGIYEERIAAMHTIYQGGPQAGSLLASHHISLVVIGPAELAAGANKAWFDQHYPTVVQQNGYIVYRVK
jgi:hypothetical protein